MAPEDNRFSLSGTRTHPREFENLKYRPNRRGILLHSSEKPPPPGTWGSRRIDREEGGGERKKTLGRCSTVVTRSERTASFSHDIDGHCLPRERIGVVEWVGICVSTKAKGES
jgi:hypothetical protein